MLIFQTHTHISFSLSSYLGYDQVCGLAGEAVRPKRDLPLAILWTLILVTLIYMGATAILNGMQPWMDISSVAGFPAAFYAHDGAHWAGHITALGEILTLPLVVWVQGMVQPRLQYAMAQDGLLPAFFAQTDARGNLFHGTAAAGCLLIFIATFVPFEHLNDTISCAVLLALSLTDSSLILLWHEAPYDDNGENHSTGKESHRAQQLVLAFHAACVVSSALLTHGPHVLGPICGPLVGLLAILVVAVIPYCITVQCPRAKVFGGRRHHHYYHHEELQLRQDDDSGGYFRTPLVPYWPCLGIFINWYLVMQMSIRGMAGLLLVLSISSIYYFISHFYFHQHPRRNSDVDDESLLLSTSPNGDKATYGINANENTQLIHSISLSVLH